MSALTDPGRAMSSLSQTPFDAAALAASLAANDIPPELRLGEVALVIDQGGLIIAAEPICSALFHWEPSELVGHALEVLLVAGTDNIRQQLVPETCAPGAESEPRPRLFALAQRKDGTSFPVAVTLELIPPSAGSWWALAFQDVSSPPLAQPEAAAVHPSPAPWRCRAQLSALPGLESIPDIFQRAPDEAVATAEPPVRAAIESSLLAGPEEPGKQQVAPGDAPVGLPSQQSQSQATAAAAAATPAAAPAPPAQTNAEAHLQELKQRLKQSAADLKRTRVHLQQQDEQLHAAKVAAQQAATALEEERARCSQLGTQLAQARQSAEELNSHLATEQQTRAEAEARLQEMEQRLAQTVEELQEAQARNQPPPPPAPAPLEPDPALQEQLVEFESRLRTAVTSLARATADLETERGERRRTEQRAAAHAVRMQQLHEELKNHLETEQIDRKRLAELDHQLHEQTQQNDLAVSKLQSALQLEQCERKRLESELQRSRFLSTDTARASRALVNGLRRQLQPPVESLHQSACQLLQLQLSDEQKNLVQAVLESTLLVQTSLQESPEG